MKPQKTLNSRSKLRKKGQSYQTILQDYGNKKQHGTDVKTDI